MIFTLTEAAEMIGGSCSRELLRREIDRGRLRALRIGSRRIGIRPEALQEYLEAREAEGVAVRKPREAAREVAA